MQVPLMGGACLQLPLAHACPQEPAPANVHGSVDGPLSHAAVGGGGGSVADLEALQAGIAARKGELAPRVQQLRAARESFQVTMDTDGLSAEVLTVQRFPLTCCTSVCTERCWLRL